MSTERIDFIGAAQMHRRNNGRMRLAPEGRRARDNAFDAGRFRGNHTHVRGGDHGIPSARHVATNAIDGNVFVAKNDAGKCLHLHVLKRGALHQREIPDLSLRELNVVDHTLRQGA
jgi:hypothetical protein